jgi:hypothetical protein
MININIYIEKRKTSMMNLKIYEEFAQESEEEESTSVELNPDIDWQEIIGRLYIVDREISWNDVLQWYNDNDFEYARLRDLDMYIEYIKNNI